jgi:uncharacterized protein (DUF169 family)
MKKTSVKEWHELGKELRRYINPETFPVVVRILQYKKRPTEMVKEH